MCSDKPFSLRGRHLKPHLNSKVLFKNHSRYSAGIIDGPLELLSDSKLTKPIPGQKPLQPDGPDEDWATWFIDFEQEMERRRATTVQWVDALLWMCSSRVKDIIQQAYQSSIQAGVPERVLYDVVRDHLLSLNANKYHPMTYLSQLENIKPGD